MAEPQENRSIVVSCKDSSIVYSGPGKIKEYNLEDFVTELSDNGYALKRIARECNKLLSERNDGRTYIEVNYGNVKNYLATHKKTELAVISKDNIDMDYRAAEMCNVIEDEIDKLRNSSGPIAPEHQSFFIRLLNTHKGLLELELRKHIGENSGEGPSEIKIVALFSKQIQSMVEKVISSNELPSELKSTVVNIINESIPNLKGDKPSD